MGYHIVLLRSPAKAITWKQLSTAARKLGWEADDATREVRLTDGDRLAARVIQGDDGEPWCKLMDDAELGHVIRLADALGARARGDEFESYRSVDDWYVHPDDEAERSAARSMYRNTGARRVWRRLWDTFRVAVLVCLAVFLVIRLTKG
jgi:hypothetical protein